MDDERCVRLTKALTSPVLHFFFNTYDVVYHLFNTYDVPGPVLSAEHE